MKIHLHIPVLKCFNTVIKDIIDEIFDTNFICIFNFYSTLELIKLLILTMRQTECIITKEIIRTAFGSN